MRLWRLRFALFLLSTVRIVSAQVSEPEEMAGRWEVSDGNGGEVGMNIILSTTVAGTATDLVSAPQASQGFDIGLYQRKDTDVQPRGFSFFSTSSKGGAVWSGRELQIDHRQIADSPEMHVKLAWIEETRAWTGTFERGAFQGRDVTLRRPTGYPKSLFTGTWFDSKGLMNNCLHIAQSEDGTLTAWGDDLQMPGQTHYANGTAAPERVMEHYGEVAKVKVTGPDRIEVELRAYTTRCCSHPFAATISADGSLLVGEWPAGGNQVPRPVKWTRVEGGSCRAAASQH